MLHPTLHRLIAWLIGYSVSSIFLWLGIVSLVALVVFDVWLVQQIIIQFSLHQKLYQNFLQDLVSNFPRTTM